VKKIILDHDKVNAVWSTDWHNSEIPIGRRRDNYKAAILRKIEFVRDLTEQFKAVGLCGGDVFHHKKPKHAGNSFNLIIGLHHLLSRFPTGRVYGSIGNHDLYFDRMDSLPHQPLGLLIATGAYWDLNREAVMFCNRDESVRVSVETFPYADGEDTLKAILAAGPRLPNAHYRVGIVHAYGEPGNGGSLFGEPKIGYNQLKDIDFDVLLWGHDHSRKETETVGNVTHINLGSLARAALPTDEDGHPVVATILSFAKDGFRYKEKEIPVTPLEVAFTAADKSVERVNKSAEIAQFIAEMDEAVSGLQTSDAREVVKEVCGGDSKLMSLIFELCPEL
jgi:hypothetical protein